MSNTNKATVRDPMRRRRDGQREGKRGGGEEGGGGREEARYGNRGVLYYNRTQFCA